MKRKIERNNELDIFIGKKIEKRRKELNLTLKDIANELGVVYQQVKKYELGVNFVKASDLPKLCNILKVKISYFYKTNNEESNVD